MRSSKPSPPWPPTQLRPLHSLRRHPVAAVIAATLPIVVAVGVIGWAPRRFASEAKLYLRVGRESVAGDPAGEMAVGPAGQPTSLHLTREHEIESAIGVMHSRDILQQTLQRVASQTPAGESNPTRGEDAGGWLRTIKDKLRSIDPVPEDQRAIRNLARDLEIDASPQSSVATVSYRHGDPETAQRVVAAWIDAYQDQHARLHRSGQSLSFFADQQSRLEKLLDDAREKLRSAKDRYGLATLGGGQESVQRQMSTLQTRRSETAAGLASITRRIETLERILRDGINATIESETKGKSNQARDTLRAALFELEVQQQELQSRLVPGHPKLEAIAMQIAQTRSIVAGMEADRTETTRQINPSYQLLQQSMTTAVADRDAASAKLRAIEDQIAELQRRQSEINAGEGELTRLQNDVEILQSRYADHQRRYEQARVNQRLADRRLTSIAVIQRPVVEHRPVSPNKPAVAAVGLLGAMACLIGVPVWLDYRLLHRKDSSGLRGDAPEDGDEPAVWDFAAREGAAANESSGELVSAGPAAGS